ncbi:hypothetical protein DEO72_LG3g1064 [Vigna unguiculata]|uniref:Uncharacterized protein n=1 Tax=Vigna unguiculata TaxID=3917 RepID=A0A4D6LD61_VIGUN|nr:hypothetical protein DEO72_LG3g1064 [Vigna unguiculata]
MNYLAVMNFRQVMRVCWARFLVILGVVGLSWSGKNNGIVVTGNSKLFSIDFDRAVKLGNYPEIYVKEVLPGDRERIEAIWGRVRLARSGGWQHLAARVPRQAIYTAAALSFIYEIVIYSASSDALRVRLLVFLELWLGTNPGVVARVGECCWCECAGCGQYGWVQMDCPPQLLADEFGSLGTIRTMFVHGNSTWRCGV